MIWDYRIDDRYERASISLVFYINFQGNENILNKQEQRISSWIYISDLIKDELSYFDGDKKVIDSPKFDELNKPYIKLIEVWSKYKKVCAEY